VPTSQTASLQTGRIDGTVVDDAGRPLSGVALSAERDEINFASTDALGRFTFRALSPGTYWVRAKHEGFVNAPRQSVLVRSTSSTTYTIQLKREATASLAPESGRVVTASFGVDLGIAPADASPEAIDPPLAASGAEPTALDEPTDHGSFAWRLRHHKRSVLREESTRIADLDYSLDRPVFDPSILLGAFESSARLAASLFSALPLSGQVRFLTTSAFDAPRQLFSSDATGAEGVAHVALESRSGDWTAQAAMVQGDIASWMAAGNYRLEPTDAHAVDVGVSYAAQRYDGINPAALNALTDGGRNVGTVSATDQWTVSKSVRLTSTLRYGRYDYLDRSNLFSPALSVAVSPFDGTWVKASVSQMLTAPGAEEFTVTRAADSWGPPQRTFSAAQGWDALRPERTRHVELGIERELGSFIVGIKRLEQRVDDQVLTAFGAVDALKAAPDLRHYVVASVGQADVTAWTVVVARPVGSRVSGAIEYSIVDARLTPSQTGVSLIDGLPAGWERMHDLTGSVEACISETRTRVSALYKVSSGFAQATADGLARRGDGRFDVQVHQGLPVPGARAAEWELLVAVRNLFFDRTVGASSLNELLVVRPPKRVLGGVSVKF
jgi:hypothetical protein